MLLLLAASIWLIGSFSLFLLLQRALDFGLRRRRQWAAVSAVVGGTAVWSTHFIAMLGHRDVLPLHYDVSLTALSIVTVIASFWAALLPLARRRDKKSAIIAGTIVTAGVTIMHYMGMAAVIGVRMHYDPVQVTVALVVTAAMFASAFIDFVKLTGWRQIVMPPLLAVLAVCTLHFGTMAATSIELTHAAGGLGEIDRIFLVIVVSVTTALLLVVVGAAFIIDRYLTDLRGLADATLEGLAIVHAGKILEANTRFAKLVGIESRQLVGLNPEHWLVAADALPLLAPRPSPVEVALAGMEMSEQVFEAATHSIEYRGRECIVVALRDLTDERAAQRQIEHMARHDPLTDLPNRALLDERIAHGVALAQRDGQSLAVLALDLDRFKAVNDIFGHSAGDQVLIRVAALLKNCTRATDTVARIGGDEFMILQIGAAQPMGARILTQRILDAFAQEMDLARDPTAVGVSIGVAVYPDDAVDPAALRHGADIALYRAKESGRGLACFFDQGMDRAVRERRALEHDLRHAVIREQLHVVYQPLVTTADGKISGYEGLLRWTHPERGDIPPDTFVPIAEDTGSIVQLGEWVLREACTTAAQWAPGLTLAINVSAVQFQVGNLPEVVAGILEETGFPADRLELEITETVLMKDRESARALLEKLKALGVSIVMDDFGTGYSSLSNLQSFPFDKIKIDRSFVAAVEQDDAARSIIRAIVGIGRSLSLPVVAEGVETPAQHRLVLEEGCAQVQGFLFGYPERVAQTAPPRLSLVRNW